MQLGVVVVRRGILEPKWGEVGILGKGGIMPESETESAKCGAHEGVRGNPEQGVRGGAVCPPLARKGVLQQQ